MKTKIILSRFDGTFGTLRFDENCFFNRLLGFTRYWDYKLTNAIHADSPGAYTSGKILNLSTVDKIHLKIDVIYDVIINGIRESLLFF